MNATIQNSLHAPAFEVPHPVNELGRDGDKFYRCYDALADELDEDMVKGLKEQLDGMLIFAGLFAGVNSAFLALTLPLLSADSADDIVTLLVQNQAILIQMATDTNVSIPATPHLPSTNFSPSGDIFAVNALFSLSLTFAIISSFLAVLGRQWLVDYRKRSGGGPEHQRWEQLKRFLGAERWRLKPILDVVLPSLLQMGLIIFCASLVLYLRHLSPAISVIVGIPMCAGLVFFIGSALCTVWDKFCPFQSPLSHIILWSARNLPATVREIKLLEWDQMRQALSPKRWVHLLIHGREEESPGSLQVIALKRAICTSDDQATLLNATANIFGIRDVGLMEELWNDPSFEDRFVDQWQSSYHRILELRGNDEVIIATASQRLYSAAAAHVMIYRNTEWYGYRSDAWQPWCEQKSILIPESQIRDSSTCLIQSTLGCMMLRFSQVGPTPETMDILCNYLLACLLLNLERQDLGFLCLLSLITSRLSDFKDTWATAQDSIREALKGSHSENAWHVLPNAAMALLAPGSTAIPHRNLLLNKLFACIDQIITDSTNFTTGQWFSFLEGFEWIVRNPQLPEEARQVIKKIRLKVAEYWQEQCARTRYTVVSRPADPSRLGVSTPKMPGHLPYALEQYITKIRSVNLAEGGHDDCIDVLRVFGSSARQLVGIGYERWEEPANKARRVRAVDELWCYWDEERVSATYSLP
ncbi:hypothetical protein FRC00_009065 [Tulasnella sp. 408]|nr:hypothetical protein FRC00_009065 [Tulasnella sp. 408]